MQDQTQPESALQKGMQQIVGFPPLEKRGRVEGRVGLVKEEQKLQMHS
jgi:hypothetical protein